MLNLSAEILHHILESTSPLERRALCLTSKGIKPFAQPKLFENLVLLTDQAMRNRVRPPTEGSFHTRSFAKFWRIIITSPHLLDHIKSLALMLIPPNHNGYEGEVSLVLSAMAANPNQCILRAMVMLGEKVSLHRIPCSIRYTLELLLASSPMLLQAMITEGVSFPSYTLFNIQHLTLIDSKLSNEDLHGDSFVLKALHLNPPVVLRAVRGRLTPLDPSDWALKTLTINAQWQPTIIAINSPRY
jgi:hypothetical protein